ncbi:MAG: histidinol-phosphate transaminase [SAR202 cluster bacterium]|nr:histidinol-phosphate transaminase [SAR202 cluster bacterium]
MTVRKAEGPLAPIRPNLLNLPPYEAVDPPEVLARRAGIPEAEIVKLNGNENPYGPSPRVLGALANLDNIAIYPDPLQANMRRALGRYLGVPADGIVVGNGSDEIIDLLFRAVLGSGDLVVDSTPTFGMYRFTAQVCGGDTVSVPRGEGFEVDVEGVLKAARTAKIIVLASPNNPTGNSVSRSDVERLLASGKLVIVDEAYGEFDGESVAPLAFERDNLVVLRTMSKWAGLAGLRVGYGVMPPPLAELLLVAKPPYNVNQAAEAALLASLEDADLLNERARLIVRERDRMSAALGSMPGVTAYPSEANFVLFRVPPGKGKAVYEGMARRGVFVRYYSGARLADYVRITAGTPRQTDRVIAAFAAALND